MVFAQSSHDAGKISENIKAKTLLELLTCTYCKNVTLYSNGKKRYVLYPYNISIMEMWKWVHFDRAKPIFKILPVL